MARHRNIRNIDIDDELDDDPDSSHPFGTSLDDEVPPSPGTARFLYQRPNLGGYPLQIYDNGSLLKNFDSEDYSYEEKKNDGEWQDTQFYLEEVDEEDYERDKGPVPHPSSSRTEAQRPVPEEKPRPPNQKPSASARNGSTGTPSRSRPAEPYQPVLPEIENLRLSKTSDKKEGQKGLTASPALKQVSSSRRLSALAAAQSSPTASPKIRHKAKDAKPLINFVIVGHVDSGKSTLMGHLLYKLGYVDDRTMHKYKQEASKTGKASFAFAWVLDETQEERERGVTMDIARMSFETPHRKIVILDAPGHKDFIHNMIAGAGQADAGLLVVNATRGEFETGFDQGGQTREHAMLLRSLGVGELMVAVNKLDTVDWSKQRFDEICAVLQTFLSKQAGFSKVRFIPLSGLCGDNLTETPPSKHPLMQWYNGPTLLQLIDEVKEPARAENRPLRAVINDVFRSTETSVSVSVKVEAGSLETGEKMYIMPNADPAVIKAVSKDGDSEDASVVAFSGEHAFLTLAALNSFEPDSITCGQVLCRGGEECLVPAKRFVVRIVVFNIIVPIMKGSRADLFAHALCEPCTIVRLEAALNKASGEVLKRKPRCLTRNMSGVVEIETDKAICVEPFSACRPLGRLTLRSAGQTIAAGIVEKIIS